MNFFLNNDGRIKHDLKLISVHIPKSAGTSFRNTLREVYGADQVVRLDINLEDEAIRVNEQLWDKKKLSRDIQVAHGHFSPLLFEKYFRSSPAPFITWLRDPVERVISNFYYLEKRLKEELDEEGKGLNILSKMQRTLSEYVADPINQNRIAKFLQGRSLDDFAFVGIQEYYAEDLVQLGQKLSWKEVPHYHHNATGKSRNVSATLRDEITRCNQEDVALYEYALSLRKKRR
jgi:hypothetical protein